MTKRSPDRRLALRAIAPVLLATIQACAVASVPAESVELSVAVGEGITDLQNSHEAFVQDYFRLSRQRVEDFLHYRWVPEFLETMVRDADLMRLLNTPEPLEPDDLQRIREEVGQALRFRPGDVDEVVAAVQRALGDADRGKLILEFADAAANAIARQRAELIDPINAQEAHALKELRAAYTELRAMQEVITTHLQSVHEVQVQQEMILARLGALTARDQAVNAAVNLNDQIVSLLSQSGSAEQTVNRILELVGREN